MAVALEHGEIQAIKKEILNEADERYVKIESCTEKQDIVNKKLANDDKRIDLLIAKTEVWEKLLWAIASSSIGALVVAFLQLVLK